MIKLNLKPQAKAAENSGLKGLIQNEWARFYCNSLSPLEALYNGISAYALVIAFGFVNYLFITNDPFIHENPFRCMFIVVGSVLYFVLTLNKKYYRKKK